MSKLFYSFCRLGVWAQASSDPLLRVSQAAVRCQRGCSRVWRLDWDESAFKLIQVLAEFISLWLWARSLLLAGLRWGSLSAPKVYLYVLGMWTFYKLAAYFFNTSSRDSLFRGSPFPLLKGIYHLIKSGFLNIISPLRPYCYLWNHFTFAI